MATLIEPEQDQAASSPRRRRGRTRRPRQLPPPTPTQAALLDELTEATQDYLHLLDLSKAARWRQRSLIYEAIEGAGIQQVEVTRRVDLTREHVHRIVGDMAELPAAIRRTFRGTRALYDALRAEPAYRAAARDADRIARETDDRTPAEARRHAYDRLVDPVFGGDPSRGTPEGAAGAA